MDIDKKKLFEVWVFPIGIAILFGIADYIYYVQHPDFEVECEVCALIVGILCMSWNGRERMKWAKKEDGERALDNEELEKLDKTTAYKKLFYYSILAFIVDLFFELVCIGYGIFLIYYKLYLFGIVCGFLGLIQLKSSIPKMFPRQPLFKLADKIIWVQGFGVIIRDEIDKIIFEQSHISHRYFFRPDYSLKIYLKSSNGEFPDVTLSLSEIKGYKEILEDLDPYSETGINWKEYMGWGGRFKY